MTNPIDFGPSELRPLDRGALQERVRVLEAHIANMSDIGGRGLAVPTEDRLAAINEWNHYQQAYGIFEICQTVRKRRARALSEMAAADAEMLP